MTRRRLLCGLLLLSAVLVCVAGWLWAASGSRVSSARFKDVKRGMSREQVIRTVGGPPGDYLSDGDGDRNKLTRFGIEAWVCDDADLHVEFDDADMATNVIVRVQRPLTLPERIRRWL